MVTKQETIAFIGLGHPQLNLLMLHHLDSPMTSMSIDDTSTSDESTWMTVARELKTTDN